MTSTSKFLLTPADSNQRAFLNFHYQSLATLSDFTLKLMLHSS